MPDAKKKSDQESQEDCANLVEPQLMTQSIPFLKVRDYESGRVRLINIRNIISVTDSYNGDCFIKTIDGTVIKTVESFTEILDLLGES